MLLDAALRSWGGKYALMLGAGDKVSTCLDARSLHTNSQLVDVRRRDFVSIVCVSLLWSICTICFAIRWALTISAEQGGH